MNKIVVIGSINADFITAASRFPMVGETMYGQTFQLLPGGKGANQAVCAAKLGADVTMLGCVGNDANGKYMMQNLQENHVCVEHIAVLDDTSTGVASIVIAENDNAIIIVPGANAHVSISYVNQHSNILRDADLVMLQLEIPLETVVHVISFCHALHIPIMLNPAPAMKLPQDVLEKVTYLTPNEVEITQLFQAPWEEVLAHHPNQIIMTAGKQGVYFHDGICLHQVHAHAVEVVDTTGAGDTVNGAFASKIVNDATITEAVEYAVLASSKTIQKIGAQSAMPFKEELEA